MLIKYKTERLALGVWRCLSHRSALIAPCLSLIVFRFLLSAFCFSLVTACTRLPNVQGKGEALLQGMWNQDTVANTDRLLSYTTHQFKFSCDSFYVDLTTHAKVNYYEEDCFNNGHWKEYAKGTYTVSGDTLFLKGTFTKSNYKQKVSGCYRNGQYLVNFKIKQTGSDRLVLQNLNDHNECVLNLKQKIICIPKPL